MVMSTKTNTK